VAVRLQYPNEKLDRQERVHLTVTRVLDRILYRINGRGKRSTSQGIRFSAAQFEVTRTLELKDI
jgi:hypothetical protein